MIDNSIAGVSLIIIAFVWLVFAYFKWLSKPRNRDSLIVSINDIKRAASRLLIQHQLASEASRISPNLVQSDLLAVMDGLQEKYDAVVEALERQEDGSVYDQPIEEFINQVNTEITNKKDLKSDNAEIRQSFHRMAMNTIHQLDTIGRPSFLRGHRNVSS